MKSNVSFISLQANVACRMQPEGYTGGVPYIHVALNTYPVIMSNVSCIGNETSLFDCDYQMWGDSGPCQHSSYEAGVICYKEQGKNKIIPFNMDRSLQSEVSLF